jgi:hypothetical protein
VPSISGMVKSNTDSGSCSGAALSALSARVDVVRIFTKANINASLIIFIAPYYLL